MPTNTTRLKNLDSPLPFLRQISTLKPTNTSPVKGLRNSIVVRELGLNAISEVNLIRNVDNLTTDHS